MPGLVAFGRRWGIGSDDLVFPGMAEVLFRAIWLLTVATIFHTHKDTFQCAGGNLIHTFYIGELALLTSHIFVSLIIVRISMSGSIANSSPRKRLLIFLYLKVTLALPEIVWIALGTFWAFYYAGSDCESVVVVTVKFASLAGWAAFFAVVIGLLFVFDPLGSQSAKTPVMSPRSSADRRSQAKKVWEYRCKLLFCCAGSDEESRNAFDDIADYFSRFFEGLDIVPTDIAAGLILLQLEQQKQPHKLHLVPIASPSTPNLNSSIDEDKNSRPDISGDDVDIQIAQSSNSSANKQIYNDSFDIHSSSEDISSGVNINQSDIGYPKAAPWMEIGQITHYMDYAMASYGWPLYKFRHLCTGCCQLYPQCRCCTCTKCLPTNIIEDNCCMCHTAAIKTTTNIHEEDIIYASFYNRIYEIPFFVALNHKEKSVVISVRGTLSLRDTLTDMTVESQRIEDEAGIEGAYAHKGMLQAANFIKDQLEKRGILEKAFQYGEGYKLVVVGHSLGAGAATLLSILLRPSYPDLKCFAYSPPGGLLSLSAARYTEEFICSVVLGKDLIPRLAVGTMEDLKIKLLRVIKDCNLPKYRVLACACCAYSGTDDRVEPVVSGVRRHLLGNTDARAGMRYTGSNPDLEKAEDKSPQAMLQEAIIESGRSRLVYQPLYPPGCIMFIEETNETSQWFREPTYVAAWTRAEAFNEIIVSPKMLTDHLPDLVCRALRQLNSKNQNPVYNVHVDQQEVVT